MERSSMHTLDSTLPSHQNCKQKCPLCVIVCILASTDGNGNFNSSCFALLDERTLYLCVRYSSSCVFLLLVPPERSTRTEAMFLDEQWQTNWNYSLDSRRNHRHRHRFVSLSGFVLADILVSCITTNTVVAAAAVS